MTLLSHYSLGSAGTAAAGFRARPERDHMTDRTLEPDAAFLARFADMDAAPDAPESYAATVERMARAMHDIDGGCAYGWGDQCPRAAKYRRLAAAAFRAEHEDGPS